MASSVSISIYKTFHCIQTLAYALTLCQGPCVGGACLWFSEGCFLGCSTCSSTMPKNGNQHDVPNCTDWQPNTPTLPEEFRTYNADNSSTAGDWTRYHPWRSPGKAPISDPCGVAGAYLKPTGGGGETPPGAKQGDRGSLLPPTNRTKWTAGGVAEVGYTTFICMTVAHSHRQSLIIFLLSVLRFVFYFDTTMLLHCNGDFTVILPPLDTAYHSLNTSSSNAGQSYPCHLVQ